MRLAFSDLDRTLIYSSRAAERPVEGMALVEELNGRPVSYINWAAFDIVGMLLMKRRLIPVTTRTTAQYERIHFRSGVTVPIVPEYAITTNGAVILHHGVPDSGWTEHIAAEMETLAAPLSVASNLLEGALPSLGTAPRSYNADNVFVYGVVDAWLPEVEAVEAQLRAVLEPIGYELSRQGRKVYVVPRCVTKGDAIREVAHRRGATRTVGAGDSLLDLSLIEAVDAAIRPGHGELADAGVERWNLAATAGSGAAAGEEIARWLDAETR